MIFFDWEQWNAFAGVISFNDPVDGLLFGVTSGSKSPCYLKASHKNKLVSVS